MKTLNPVEAFDYLAQIPESLLLDVRSTIEFHFVGHPVGAVHIPWNDGDDWQRNPQFVAQVLRLVDNDRARPLVLICRSGSRSAEAGMALEAAGFDHVINVVHGFEGDRDDQLHRNVLNGWRFDGLPWEQS